MKLDFSFPNNYTMDLRLESMQPTVKSLKFNVSMDSQLRRYFELEGSTPLIKTIFPELHTLEMPQGLTSPVNLRLAVPASLTKLVIAHQITLIDNDLMKYLPHLTHLEGSCSPVFLDGPTFLPPGLETLRLCDCPTTSIFGQLKPIAGLKSLFVELTATSSEAKLSGWISHLLNLSQVLDLGLHFHDQTGIFEVLFMSLPPSLTRLKLRQHKHSGVIPTAEQIITAKFPPGLTDLDLGPILLNTPRSELLRAFPSQLRRLHFVSTEGSQALAAHELKLLPRSLTTLEGLCFSPTQSAVDLPPMMRNFILPRMEYSVTDEIFESLPVSGLERISASFSLTPRSLDHLKAMKRLRYVSDLNTDLFEILSPDTQAKEEVSPQSLPPLAAQESPSSAYLTGNGSFASPSSFSQLSSSRRNAKSTGVSRGIRNASASKDKNTPISTAPDPTVHYDPLRCFIPQHIHTMHISHSTAAAVNRPLQLDFCSDRQKVQAVSMGLSIRELKVRYQRLRGQNAIYTSPKGPSLRSLSDFPSSLVTLHIGQFEVNPSIFLNMSNCHNLENLVIEECADSLLEDKHIFALPKQIRMMRIRGSPCMVTIEGYRALPPYLITLTLPICPFADEKMNKLDFLEMDALWPKRCSTPYFNSPGTTLPVPQWIMVLKKRHKTHQISGDPPSASE